MGKASLQTQTVVKGDFILHLLTIKFKPSVSKVQLVQKLKKFPASSVVKVGKMIIFYSIYTSRQPPEFGLNYCA